MGKKKFSRDDDDDNTTDDETQNGGQGGGPTSSSSPACPHVGKAVNISELKKALKVAWVRIGKCGPCERDKKTDSSQKMRLQNGGPNDGKKKSAARYRAILRHKEHWANVKTGHCDIVKKNLYKRIKVSRIYAMCPKY
jgi:hypothetical protein